MKYSNITTFNLFTNKVNVDLNMFGALMEYWITGQINGTNVVTIDKSSCRNRKVKLKE